jgi:hypothetical protein
VGRGVAYEYPPVGQLVRLVAKRQIVESQIATLQGLLVGEPKGRDAVFLCAQGEFLLLKTAHLPNNLAAGKIACSTNEKPGAMAGAFSD